jgi:hypothetical protein
MRKPRQGRREATGLNPSLKSRTDATHDTTRSTPPPADSASVQREEGRGWSIAWAVVAIAGVLVVLWLLL